MDARSQRLWLIGACVVMLAASQVSAASADSEAAEARALRVQAERLAARGEVGEAIDVAARATRVAPRDAAAWALLASLHREAGHGLDAQASLASCVRLARGAAETCIGVTP